MGARLIGLNVRGLRDSQALFALIREAKRKHTDVLLLQEVNVRQAQVKTFTENAENFGFRAYVSTSSSTGERGGTAILVRGEGPVKVTEVIRDDETGDTMGGRVCAVEASFEGGAVSGRLVSVYAPQQGPDRVCFFNDLREKNLIDNNTICQGDFNCVPKPGLDSANPHEGNAGAKECDQLMNEAGLTDVYRFIHGDKRGGFTRTTDTTQRRLDRFYAARYNSEWRWVEIDVDGLYFRHSKYKSDHLAVTACIEWSGARKRTPSEARVNTELFKVQEVRDTVTELWNAAYKHAPPSQYGAIRPYQLAKKAVAEYLIEKTKEPGPMAIEKRRLEAELQLRHQIMATKGPSSMRQAAILKIEERLSELEQEATRTQKRVYGTLQREEVSSKEFYRTFKAKLKRSDSSSIHCVPDWDHPDQRNGVEDTSEGVVRELTGYYRRRSCYYLYSIPYTGRALPKYSYFQFWWKNDITRNIYGSLLQ